MKSAAAEMIRDTIAVVGGSVTLWGLWLIYPPLALITAGVSMVAIAWMLATSAVNREEKEENDA